MTQVSVLRPASAPPRPATPRLHLLALRAMQQELREFDWSQLDPATTRTIHALLPPLPRP